MSILSSVIASGQVVMESIGAIDTYYYVSVIICDKNKIMLIYIHRPAHDFPMSTKT